MNKYVKSIVGALIILIPALVLAGFLLNKLTEKSFYPNSGTVHITGINSNVRIYSDEYGVPHIFASNEHDMYFSLGYMHAQDRLWQMDIMRRAAEGRLSEIFGSRTLDFDKLFRTIGIGKNCIRLKDNISPKSKEILNAYCEGVNEFIRQHTNRLPVEFDILNYKPYEWKPEHSLMLIRMMGWEMNLNWFTDYVMGEIIDKAGIEKISGIFPDSTMSIYKKEPVVADTTKADSLEIKPGAYNKNNIPNQLFALGEGFCELNKEYRKFFGLSFDFSGSNCWVVNGQRSESGRPILANDPHMLLMAPSRWYEAHIKDGDMDVTGMSFAGVPGIAIGHNRVVCWGLTNLMNDDNDFIVFDKVPGNKLQYKYKGQVLTLDSLTEDIRVKDSADVYYTVKYTVQGPVLSDLKKRSLLSTEGDSGAYRNKLMTFKWTGFEFSDEILSFYKLNRSRNWDDFREGLKNFGTPGLNFSYADTAGNIGYQAAGKIPIRKTNSYSYVYPSTDELEWTGFVEFDRMPSLFNPKDGYIATANTNPFEWLKTELKNRFYITYGWAPFSRLNRIQEFLNIRNRYNADEFKLLQLDNSSPYAKMITRYVIQAFKNYKTDNRLLISALDKLKIWNFDMDKNEPVPAVYNEFLVKLEKNLFLQKFGDKVFEDFLLVCYLPLCMTERVLTDTTSGWFDNIGVSYSDKRDIVIRQSFLEVLETLSVRYNNSSIDDWKWGDIHKIKFMHLLGEVSILDRSFNIGPYEVGGDQTTVNNSTYDFTKAYKSGSFDDMVGPSMRMITDLADMDHTYSVNSTGQSGQPLHPNYEDQSRLWIFGDYKIVVMNEYDMQSDKYKLLMLIPEK